MTKPKTYKIAWARMGWSLLPGSEMPSEGPISVLVVSPWCPDCQSLLPKAVKEAPPGMPMIAGEFAAATEIERFVRDAGISWPIAAGTSMKDENSRNLARFREIRQCFGDSRTWGVPTWIEGELKNGWFTVHRASGWG